MLQRSKCRRSTSRGSSGEEELRHLPCFRVSQCCPNIPVDPDCRYCEHDLAALIDAHSRPFSESEAKSISLQLLSALSYLHDRFIIHRDLKLSNLLYNNRGQVKLADFGMSRKMSADSMTTKVVTLWYRCPEILIGYRQYDSAVDIWSLGCIHCELVSGTPLLPGRDELDQVRRIFALLGAPTQIIWPGFDTSSLFTSGDIDLALEQRTHIYNNLSQVMTMMSAEGLVFSNELLLYDPTKRLCAKDALSHTYFRSSPLPKEPYLMPTFPTSHKLDPPSKKAKYHK